MKEKREAERKAKERELEKQRKANMIAARGAKERAEALAERLRYHKDTARARIHQLEVKVQAARIRHAQDRELVQETEKFIAQRTEQLQAKVNAKELERKIAVADKAQAEKDTQHMLSLIHI